MFFQVSSLFSVSPFFFFFSISIFVFFWNLPFESLSCSILKKIVFFSRSFSFIFFTFHSVFITFCFHLFQHLLQFDTSFQCLLILLASFFFENVSSLTFFAHMFLSSLSFFLFHRFSFLFLISLVFRVFFYLHFFERIVFSFFAPVVMQRPFHTIEKKKKLGAVTHRAL